MEKELKEFLKFAKKPLKWLDDKIKLMENTNQDFYIDKIKSNNIENKRT